MMNFEQPVELGRSGSTATPGYIRWGSRQRDHSRRTWQPQYGQLAYFGDRGASRLDYREGNEAAKTDLNQLSTNWTSRTGPRLGLPVVCISQVPVNSWGEIS